MAAVALKIRMLGMAATDRGSIFGLAHAIGAMVLISGCQTCRDAPFNEEAVLRQSLHVISTQIIAGVYRKDHAPTSYAVLSPEGVFLELSHSSLLVGLQVVFSGTWSVSSGSVLVVGWDQPQGEARGSSPRERTFRISMTRQGLSLWDARTVEYIEAKLLVAPLAASVGGLTPHDRVGHFVLPLAYIVCDRDWGRVVTDLTVWDQHASPGGLPEPLIAQLRAARGEAAYVRWEKLMDVLGRLYPGWL